MPTILQQVFRIVADRLQPAGIDCLLIGGFAVNHYGYSRSTLDVDFLIVADNRESVRDIMREAGFTNYSLHSTVMFFNLPGTPLRVDFLQTDQETLSKMLGRAAHVQFYGHLIPVPSLLDLLSMKLFALSQSPERRMGKDLPDIVNLAILNDLDVERDIRPLAMRFASIEVFEMIAGQIKALQP